MVAGMATQIPFVRDLAFEYGVVDQVTPLVRRVIARNPGNFTIFGTGTFIVGQDRVAVIDPGPEIDEHFQALMAALEGESVSHIVVSHTHRDHSPLAARLKEVTGAPTVGFGPHGSGRPEATGQVEEGADDAFDPDIRVRDGDLVEGEGWTLEAVHTPGHTSNHVCYALRQEQSLFSGDHVMGWSTSIVSPPDGDMRAYMASLEKLLGRDDRVFWPNHGPPIEDPQPFVRAFIAHRHEREAQILACLGDDIFDIPAMVARMYADVDKGLHPAAARSVLSHLIHMLEDGRAVCDGAAGLDREYRLA